jgi:hypothetical protein
VTRPRKRTGPVTTPAPSQQMPPPSSTRAILQRPDVSECHGCGAITELIQDSDFCWTCTYDPPCLCTGPRRPYNDA